jgi:N-acetylglutamate synthase-like GNAT family acetyltransferase
MGNLQVISERKNQGLGQELVQCVVKTAKLLGYEKMYFFTSNFENIAWYLKRGAKVIDKRIFHNHPIAIMEMQLIPNKDIPHGSSK